MNPEISLVQFLSTRLVPGVKKSSQVLVMTSTFR